MYGVSFGPKLIISLHSRLVVYVSSAQINPSPDTGPVLFSLSHA